MEKVFKQITEKITELIKTEQKEKKATWQQNINFILSSGDYSVFLRKENVQEKLQNTPVHENMPINNSKLEDLKNNFTI